eukprot:CAMPEP_0196717412 /NCGR_PEP_ID=MMETSP1091-20130531/779_1 /TAXON_ID=302021 /ORGANISM="Rhodomonas sp., Strain CCMP768" /LENGTH=80 /DNA_ID=CAMNT_0042057727 /DNA_START=1 /DNA_END=243 /DNA_ORIENTATION=-
MQFAVVDIPQQQMLQRPMMFPVFNQQGAMLGFLGGEGINGGQNNADPIFTTSDDSEPWGLTGPGYYGPGNGETIGNLWNP